MGVGEAELRAAKAIAAMLKKVWGIMMKMIEKLVNDLYRDSKRLNACSECMNEMMRMMGLMMLLLSSGDTSTYTF